MAQLIALEKKQQKSLKKNVDKFKNLLKTGEVQIQDKKKSKKTKKFKSSRGIVYLSHIPHGFYEEEMKKYFSQFGTVTNVKLARSKTTGKSKGHAFIEFEVPEVAKIVAETMDGYIMFTRLLKAVYIPPEQQKFKYFNGPIITEAQNPGKVNIQKNIKAYNSKVSPMKEKSANMNRIRSIKSVIKKLKDAGIEYKFEPVEVPEYLQKSLLDMKSTDKYKDQPILEIDESDTDITFVTPPGVKRVIKPKLSQEDPKSVSKVKKNLAGITKKTTKRTPMVSLKKDTQKLQLIKRGITDNNQVKLQQKINKKQKLTKKA